MKGAGSKKSVPTDLAGELKDRFEDEIKFLRKQVSELQTKLLDLATGNYIPDASPETKKEMNVPAYVDALGQVRSMNAFTDEEKEQKKQAEKQLTDMMTVTAAIVG